MSFERNDNIKKYYLDKRKSDKIKQYYANKKKTEIKQQYKIDLKYKELVKQQTIEVEKRRKQHQIILDEYAELCKLDVIHRIVNNLANRVTKLIKKYGIEREQLHIEIIGCTRDKLRYHLEKQFVSGMNFDNYGDWHVDHIKPIASYNLKDPKQFKECFNYKNLQPLWDYENWEKGSKLNWSRY